MHPIGGDRWTWSLSSVRAVEFCIWALVQDGLQVHPFDVHPNGNEHLRRTGMDPMRWSRWFEAVVNREVEREESVRLGMGFEPALLYESDTPTLAEQLRMKEAIEAGTPPALWAGSADAADVLTDMWNDYTARPALRRQRQTRDFRENGEPGTAEQHGELYGLLRKLGSSLPSLHCYSVAYPALVVQEVTPMALVISSPRQWTWDRYREELVAAVARMS